MMKIGLALAAATYLVSAYGPLSPGGQDETHGRWRGRLEDGRCGGDSGEGLCLELTLERGSRFHRSTSGFSTRVDRLDGLEAESDDFSKDDIRFALKRDAGTVRFEGSFDRGEGSGDFSFEADDEYAEALERMGYSRPAGSELLALAIHDVSRSTLEDFDRKGYHGDLDDIVAFVIHGVTPGFVDEVERLGYRHPSADQLVALRIHGVSPEFIEEMQQGARSRPSLDDLVAMRIHGVDGEFKRELADAGVEDDFDSDDLTALKIHDVNPRLARALRKLGDRVDADDLVSLAVQGVTPEYVEDMVRSGLEHLDVERLVSLKVQGIDPEWIRGMVQAGIDNLDVDELVGAKVQGIDPDYVRAMARAGFDHLDLEELTALKIQGVTEEFAREFHRDDPSADADDLVDAWLNGRRHTRHGRHRGN